LVNQNTHFYSNPHCDLVCARSYRHHIPVLRYQELPAHATARTRSENERFTRSAEPSPGPGASKSEWSRRHCRRTGAGLKWFKNTIFNVLLAIFCLNEIITIVLIAKFDVKIKKSWKNPKNDALSHYSYLRHLPEPRLLAHQRRHK